MQEFVTYKTFNDEESFVSFIDLLNTNQIPYQTEIFNSAIDSATLRPLPKEFLIKLKADDFAQVNHIQDKIAAEAAQNADPEHYLFGFTDAELYDILIKPDEWSITDYHLAKRILKDRGKVIDEDFVNTLKKNRIEELAKPEEVQRGWILSGYLFSLLGGVPGVLIGWYLMSYTKTLPDGRKEYAFAEKSRKQGKTIFYLGIVIAVISLVINLIS